MIRIVLVPKSYYKTELYMGVDDEWVSFDAKGCPSVIPEVDISGTYLELEVTGSWSVLTVIDWVAFCAKHEFNAADVLRRLSSYTKITHKPDLTLKEAEQFVGFPFNLKED